MPKRRHYRGADYTRDIAFFNRNNNTKIKIEMFILIEATRKCPLCNIELFGNTYSGGVGDEYTYK